MTETQAISLYKDYFYKQFGKEINITIKDQSPPKLSMDEIIHRALLHMEYSFDHIFNKKRDHYLVEARRRIFYTLHINGYKMTEIARRFGYDHTSVKYTLQKARDYMSVIPSYKEEIEDLLVYVAEFS